MTHLGTCVLAHITLKDEAGYYTTQSTTHKQHTSYKTVNLNLRLKRVGRQESMPQTRSRHEIEGQIPRDNLDENDGTDRPFYRNRDQAM